VLVTLGAIVLLPLLIATALAIWLTQGRPILFAHQRAGLNGAPFRMFKFRTMRVNSEKSGGSLTFKGDARITPAGKFLRNTKLDEFPQVWNVLRGEMTIVGPRPEVLDWVTRYTTEQREALSSKPGLSDPVQLLFRHEHDYLNSAEEYETLVAIKIQKQIEYSRARTAWSDFVVILRTIRTMFPSRPCAEELAVYESIRAELSLRNQPDSRARPHRSNESIFNLLPRSNSAGEVANRRSEL
jgi:lipopolysaccharide/colanic/teichoic acid biosynthesis glycosyltransferase